MGRIFLSLALITAVAAPAAAQTGTTLTPFLGVAFDTPTSEDNRLVYGGAIGVVGRIVGFEADFGYSPNFFEGTDEFGAFDSTGSVTSLMGNLILTVPTGTFRPYATAGAGLLRSNLRFTDFFDDLSRNDLGINFGAGLFVSLTDNIAIRGDVRQFRRLRNDDPDGFPDPNDFRLGDFRYWRGTAGLTFSF
jgi:opacity protein-like surface antigen